MPVSRALLTPPPPRRLTREERVRKGLHNAELMAALGGHPSKEARSRAAGDLIEYLAHHPENVGVLQAIRRTLLEDSAFEVRALARRFLFDRSDAAFSLSLDVMRRDPWRGNRTYLLITAAKYATEPEKAIGIMRARSAGRLEEGPAHRIYPVHREKILRAMEEMSQSDPCLRTLASSLLKEAKGATA